MGLHEEYQGAWNVANSQGVVFRLNLHIPCHISASFHRVTMIIKGINNSSSDGIDVGSLSMSNNEAMG